MLKDEPTVIKSPLHMSRFLLLLFIQNVQTILKVNRAGDFGYYHFRSFPGGSFFAHFLGIYS